MTDNLQNINISSQNVHGKCDLKCSYSFKYPETNVVAENKGVYINLKCDDSNSSPVLYNNKKYNVSNVFITSPSIHLFNGATVSAEIVVEHTPVSGGKQFFVGVPIVKSGEASNTANLVNSIIYNIGSNIPSENETMNLNISDFTLDNIIPKKPYFSYSANEHTDWIVFQITDAIPLSTANYNTLTSIIKPFPLHTPGNELFFNSNGPNSLGESGDGIYISCQPTGSSQDEVAVEYDKPAVSFDLGTALNNPVIIAMLVFVGFIVIFIAIGVIYSFITGKNIQYPSFIQKLKPQTVSS
jgi:carbonic anhydrase